MSLSVQTTLARALQHYAPRARRSLVRGEGPARLAGIAKLSPTFTFTKYIVHYFKTFANKKTRVIARISLRRHGAVS